MPYPQFDRSQLQILPIAQRVHDVSIEAFRHPGDPLPPFDHPDLEKLAGAVIEARRKFNAAVVLMYGAHVIRTGNGPDMIELMKRGLVTHFATNGAGSIHDYELARIGATCESVARYVSTGQFGLWTETGMINDIIKEGAQDGVGWGEALGRYIWEENLPYRESSVLGMGYHLHVPCTVHIGIGNDIIHEHPNCDGAAMGACSYTDFLVYTQSVTHLEHGVFLNFGSAVTGPEVYLKAISMARNAARQRGERIADFTTAVFDVQPLSQADDIHSAPPKSDPRYYFRPWKTILARTVADGGRSYYICGEHSKTLPNLASRICALDESGK